MIKKIKVAQIGVGYWGPNILRNLLNNKKFELSLVIEKSNSRIKYVKKISNKIKVSSNFDEILNDIKPDGLDISSSVEISPGLKDLKKTEALFKFLKKT